MSKPQPGLRNAKRGPSLPRALRPVLHNEGRVRGGSLGLVSPPRSLDKRPVGLRSPTARVSPPRLPHEHRSCYSCAPASASSQTCPERGPAHPGLPPAGREDHGLCPPYKTTLLGLTTKPQSGGISCWAPGTSAAAGFYCQRHVRARWLMGRLRPQTPRLVAHLTEPPASVSKYLESEEKSTERLQALPDGTADLFPGLCLPPWSPPSRAQRPLSPRYLAPNTFSLAPRLPHSH